MGDLEGFFGFEAGDKIDPASFEKFKERVKAASAQIKALKIGEQKQREKEEKLIKILLKFVKQHQKQDIMLLIARLLEQNVPAVFILSIVILGNEDVKKDAEEQKLLETGTVIEGENHELEYFDKQQVLPIKLKAEIDDWIKGILHQALENPHRTIQTVFDIEKNLKLPLIQLSAFILRDYLEQNDQETDYEKLKEFSDFFLNGIMKKVKEKIKSQKELEDKEEGI